jgi:signal peptidase II
MTPVWRRIALLVLVAMTVGCDRVSKHFASRELAGEPRQSFLADTVRLEYAENSGAFLSFGHDWPLAVRTGVFTIGTGLILCAMLAAALKFRLSGPALVGLALYFAGGVSNLVDRVMRGSVIDFLNVGVGPLRTGIFNVADMAILLGVGIFVYTHRRDGEADEPTSPPSAPSPSPPTPSH